jgi:Uma2 family endonuclease
LQRFRPDFYAEGDEIQPRDVLLLIEVSDSSLRYDRDRKVPIYSRSGIREVWLLDVEARVILVYREPSPDGYQVTLTARSGDRSGLVAFPGLEIAVSDLVG